MPHSGQGVNLAASREFFFHGGQGNSAPGRNRPLRLGFVRLTYPVHGVFFNRLGSSPEHRARRGPPMILRLAPSLRNGRIVDHARQVESSADSPDDQHRAGFSALIMRKSLQIERIVGLLHRLRRSRTSRRHVIRFGAGP